MADLRELALEAKSWELCDDPGCSCHEAHERFREAASPEAVLDLIAENESLARDVLLKTLDELALAERVTRLEAEGATLRHDLVNADFALRILKRSTNES